MSRPRTRLGQTAKLSHPGRRRLGQGLYHPLSHPRTCSLYHPLSHPLSQPLTGREKRTCSRPMSRRPPIRQSITALTRWTFLAALALATVSAGFSIYGFTSIFVGAFWPVIGMGIALEAGKLSAVAWLGHQRGTASRRLRAAFTVLVLILMGLNAIGCYGFLARAHIGHQVEGETAIGARAADVEARLSVQAEKVADLTKQIADLDAAHAIETPSAGNLRTASAINAQAAALAAAAKLRAADDERRQAKRTSLADKLMVEAKALADLKIEKAGAEGQRKVA